MVVVAAAVTRTAVLAAAPILAVVVVDSWQQALLVPNDSTGLAQEYSRQHPYALWVEISPSIVA